MEKHDHFAHHIAQMAQKAVLYEVTATPKPGLVDRYNTGSHKDMDFYTFMDSSAALYKGFFDCASEGLSFESDDLKVLLDRIRKPGMACESSMFAATKGVNTHKGIIFSMGIACAALGYLSKHYESIKSVPMELICKTVTVMTQDLIEKDFGNLKSKPSKYRTFGEKLYLTYGYTGIRGEVITGFQTVKTETFGLLRNWQKEQLKGEKEQSKGKKQETKGKELQAFGKNELLLEILLRLMTTCEDTNVIHRGGVDGLVYVKRRAREFVEAGGMAQVNAYERLEQMNREFCEKNLSPGGAADLLSVTVFLAMAEGLL